MIPEKKLYIYHVDGRHQCVGVGDRGVGRIKSVSY